MYSLGERIILKLRLIGDCEFLKKRFSPISKVGIRTQTLTFQALHIPLVLRLKIMT